MEPRLEVAFLWHMHQPPYRDPASGEYILPWVRLHATRAYLDMAEIHARFPGVRSTVNFVPSLLEQLEDYAAGRARDRFLELTLKRPEDLTPDERAFVLRNFFMVNWETCVRPLPRYWQLLHKRGRDVTGVDLHAIARGFSNEELRDLQVLFNLAWTGFAARERYEAIRALVHKGRSFTEGDKAALVDAQQAIVASIEPTWRALAEAGSVELTATAYYHPILPLLCDTEAARVAMPGARLPPRIRAPEDAREQVHRARAKFAAVFGREPDGMWPAEGSVSPEALAVFAGEGVKWVASDEEVLLRSLPPGVDRLSSLYRPWRVRAGDREIAMVFRDRGLSDLIGFTYARTPPKDAVNDLLGHLSRIADAAYRPGDPPPFAPIILDGENPWEGYPDSGRHFLTELFSRLAGEERGIRAVTVGERVRRLPPDSPRIERIHSGSWIEASYRIWIGHPEDVAAWTLVYEARRAIEEARAAGAPAETLAAAREHVLAAEASDWYWWYGDDFTTESAAEFDALFRGHVLAVFRLLGQKPPAAALSPISAGAMRVEEIAVEHPLGYLRPRIDGMVGSWLEWQGAGVYRPERTRGGSMHQARGAFGALYFGFDLEHLYLRLDPAGEPEAIPARMDALAVQLRAGEREVEFRTALAPGPLAPTDAAGTPTGKGAFGAIVELSIPLAAAGLAAGDKVSLAVQGLRAGVEVERLPRHGFLGLEVPDENFERMLWKV
jgi:alpha-amylase/alpha-mannosidase (GH57 family)